MEKITVTRGLVRLKTLDNQINFLIDDFKPVDISVNKKLNSKQTFQEFDANVKSGWQKINDLIKQRSKIKSGIVASNAVTMVDIVGTKMSVAAAIERKKSIEYDVHLRNSLKGNFAAQSNNVDKMNDDVKMRLDRLLESTFSKDSSKVKPDELDAVAKPFMERNEATLIDPIRVNDKIHQLDEGIDSFKEEIDIVVTESNSVTYIET
ncbi:hypothetical protein HN385_07375 [archaeon]|nr:hypothetical protein [archaeon]